MGKRATQIKSSAIGLMLTLCALVAFQNCGKFTTQSLKDSFTSLCANQSIVKLKAFAASAPVVGLKCDDPGLYRCVIRVFRPGIGFEKSTISQCTSDNVCLSVDVLRFDTEANRRMNDLPRASFDEGGEFNHEVFECLHTGATLDGLSVLTAEAGSLGEAWDQVRRACEERSHHAQ